MGGKGPSQSTVNQQNAITNDFLQVSQDQQKNSDTLFNEVGLPGLETAKGYYDKLASGDPNAIQSAVGPAEGQIDAQTAGTIKNIDATTPKGGVKLLAEDEAKISGAGQKGNLVTQAYTSAFPAEASLGSNTTGLSTAAIAQAIQGFQGAGANTAKVADEQQAGKASQLAFFGALAGGGAQVASAGLA